MCTPQLAPPGNGRSPSARRASPSAGILLCLAFLSTAVAAELPTQTFAELPLPPADGAGAYFDCEPPADASSISLWPACGESSDLHQSLSAGHAWVDAEYLLWWSESIDTPALVTTSPTGTAVGNAGILGDAGTQVLLGDSGLNANPGSGMRIRFGWSTEPCQIEGLEASYLATGRQTETFQADSNSSSILARPFFDTESATQAAMLVAYPNLLTGSILAEASTELQSAEVLYRNRLTGTGDGHIDLVVGYRHARLDEDLRIEQSSRWTAAQGQIVSGTTKYLDDLFSADTRFHGAELGLVYQERIRRWSLELAARVSMGNSHSQFLIDGHTRTTVPGGGSASFAGGLLAQETNMGRYSGNDFVAIPEFSLRLGVDLTCRLRATLGYDFLYWPEVARPGDQIDFNVSQLPPESATGAAHPEFSFVKNGLWTQAVEFGLDYRF